MRMRLIATASTLAILAFSTVSPAFAADDATIDKLSRMIEQQQKVLDAQSRELSAMRAELKNLHTKQDATEEVLKTKTVTTVTTTPAAASVPAGDKQYVEAGSFPGSIKIPGSNASFKIGGQVKADAMYTPDQTPGLSEDTFFTRTIQSGSPSSTGRTRIMARDTRLNLDVRADTDYGLLKAFTEFDLFGGSGSTTPQSQFNGYDLRLRHAYVQVNGFTVGQTWSTFTDPTSFAETMDFGQVNGESFLRQPQVRWTSAKHNDVTFSAALENPEGDIGDSVAPGTGRRTNSDNLPDVVASLALDQDWGHLQSSVLYRRLKIDNDTIAPAFDDSANGYGINVSGKINTPFINEKDTFKFQVNYGTGIGRYINDLQNTATESFDAVVNASNTHIETLDAYGGYASYQAVFSPTWRSNLTGGYVHVDQPGFQPGGALDHTTYVAGNVIWTPVPKFDVGLEALYGERTNKDDTNGDATRFIASAKYAF